MLQCTIVQITNNDNRVTCEQYYISISNVQITNMSSSDKNMSSGDENFVTCERLQGWVPSSALYQLVPYAAFDKIDV